MPKLIAAPAVVQSVGTKPKRIEEFIGRVNSGNEGVSVARMLSPSGWEEPGQRPEFEEITVVLKGMLRVEHESGMLEVRAGQAVVTAAGEWVRYSTPEPEGAEYVAILPPGLLACHRSPGRRPAMTGGAARAEPSAIYMRSRGQEIRSGSRTPGLPALLLVRAPEQAPAPAAVTAARSPWRGSRRRWRTRTAPVGTRYSLG